MELLAFTDAHLDAAAELLALRHRTHRAAEPALPARFEQAAEARKAIAAALARDGARGAVAMEDGRMLGYLLGNTVTNELMGAHAWVHLPGSAIAPGASPELIRDLYAHLADQWVRAGYFGHYVQVPAHDPTVLQMWFALGFGHQQVHAYRETAQAAPAGVPGVTVRRAGPADLEGVLGLSEVITRHQLGTPVFAYRPLEGLAEGYREGYTEVLSDATCFDWIAEREGRVVAHALFTVEETSDGDMLTPESCVYLNVGATLPSERGRGLARLLTEWGLHQAAADGYRVCITDWRSTNLLSSRTWPKLGFRPAVYRLHRLIDPKIATVLA